MPGVRAHIGRAAFGRPVLRGTVADVPSVFPQRGSVDIWEPLNRHVRISGFYHPLTEG